MTTNINTKELQSVSRRNLALGAGLAGLAYAGLNANAQTTMTGSASDLAILNYALTLEHLEASFYTRGLASIAQAELNNSDLARVLGTGVIGGVYNNLSRIRDHEVAHVNALESTIRSLGGTPVQPCTYNFSYNSPDEFLRVATLLEETGVAAYNGAIAMIGAMALKTAGASIATVEARHAAYLNLLVSQIPFPKAFDEAKTMREILAAAAPFISACGTQPVGVATTAILLPKNLTTALPQVTLDASQSMSANGQALTYMLRSLSGNASISQANSANPSVQFQSGFGDYVFELTVTDSTGATSKDTVSIRYVGR